MPPEEEQLSRIIDLAKNKFKRGQKWTLDVLCFIVKSRELAVKRERTTNNANHEMG